MKNPQPLGLGTVVLVPANTAESPWLAITDPCRTVVVATIDSGSAGRLAGWATTHYWDHPDGAAPPGSTWAG